MGPRGGGVSKLPQVRIVGQGYGCRESFKAP